MALFTDFQSDILCTIGIHEKMLQQLDGKHKYKYLDELKNILHKRKLQSKLIKKRVDP